MIDCLTKWILSILLVILLIYFYFNIYDGTVPQKNTFDTKEYYVKDDHLKQTKADLLANLYNKLNVIVNTLRNDSIKSESVSRLIKLWDRGVTVKETGNMESDAAYVINKRYMSICLKDFVKKINLENLNLLTYVGIHELSHIMSIEIGHGDEFKTNFKFLLDYSKKIKYTDPFLNQEINLYIPLNTIKTPSDYCGVSVINSIS